MWLKRTVKLHLCQPLCGGQWPPMASTGMVLWPCLALVIGGSRALFCLALLVAVKERKILFGFHTCQPDWKIGKHWACQFSVKFTGLFTVVPVSCVQTSLDCISSILTRKQDFWGIATWFLGCFCAEPEVHVGVAHLINSSCCEKCCTAWQIRQGRLWVECAPWSQ